MIDILDLPDWKATSSRSECGQYLIEADYLVPPTACVKFGSIGNLYKHGTKQTTYTDSPIRGLPVRLVANVQRYRCRDCGETMLCRKCAERAV
jgi:transposase